MNWQSAQRHCEKDGGHLAIVDTPQKVHFVMRKVMDDVWLGLKKSGRGWKWIDGKQKLGRVRKSGRLMVGATANQKKSFNVSCLRLWGIERHNEQILATN